METNTEQAQVRCIYCDDPLTVDDDGTLRDSEGFDRCPDGGGHRPVLIMEALA